MTMVPNVVTAVSCVYTFSIYVAVSNLPGSRYLVTTFVGTGLSAKVCSSYEL